MKLDGSIIKTEYERVCEEYKEKSTEWCLQFTADILEVDYMDVVNAAILSEK